MLQIKDEQDHNYIYIGETTNEKYPLEIDLMDEHKAFLTKEEIEQIIKTLVTWYVRRYK